MLKRVFAIGLLGTLGFASVDAAASDHGYRPAPPPPAYVRPVYYPRYAPRPVYYPRYARPVYAPRGWYGARYCPPRAPRYGYGYWQGHPSYKGGGHGNNHWKGHGNDHDRGNWDHH